MKHQLFKLVGVFTSLLLLSEPVWAGPGGKIASAIFDSFWGKVLLVCLVILFLPLILLNGFKRNMNQRRVTKDLVFMSQYSDHFDWIKIQQRAKECFLRVHKGWQDEDLSDYGQWMTDWYWQNQQQVFLEQWKEQGLVNICNVESIGTIRPLVLVHRNHEHDHEGSSLVVSISANMQDYLKDRASGTIVEGSEDYKMVTTLWTFTLEEGRWMVSNIDQVNSLMEYIKLSKSQPAIESTVTS